MGFKAWRNLGVWALASASLVGCTSGTANKNNQVVAPTPPGNTNNSWNRPADQPPLPNGTVFNNQQQQITPSTSSGFGAQPLQTKPSFPQTSGPMNPNAPFNPSSAPFGGPQTSTGNTFQAPGFQNPSTPGNNVQLTQPNSFAQSSQPIINNGPPAGTGFGAGYPAAPNGFQSGGVPPGLPAVPSTPGFTPPAAPPGFPTGR